MHNYPIASLTLGAVVCFDLICFVLIEFTAMCRDDTLDTMIYRRSLTRLSCGVALNVVMKHLAICCADSCYGDRFTFSECKKINK